MLHCPLKTFEANRFAPEEIGNCNIRTLLSTEVDLDRLFELIGALADHANSAESAFSEPAARVGASLFSSSHGFAVTSCQKMIVYDQFGTGLVGQNRSGNARRQLGQSLNRKPGRRNNRPQDHSM